MWHRHLGCGASGAPAEPLVGQARCPAAPQAGSPCYELVQPALRILLVVKRNSLFSELECMLRVEHHRQLFGSRSVFARHDRAGMRAVRNPARVQSNRSWFNPSTRPEIAAHVKQNLVRLNVIVYPWNPDGLWMRIEHTGRKSADDITTNLECLMNRRRLVNGAGDRLEVLRIKREWIDVAVPADDIEGMMRHRYLSPARSVLH